MKNFTDESLFEIITYLEICLKNKKSIEIEVLNPSVKDDLYCGEKLVLDKVYIYRSLKTWSDLAENLYCKLNVLEIKKETVVLKFLKVDEKSSFHQEKFKNCDDKYGKESIFFKINKNEEPTFLNSYLKALKNINIKDKKSVLNLGINKADEFEVIQKVVLKEEFEKINFFGVDFSNSAINYAKERFPLKNFNFFCHDINNLEELNLPKMDCIISIGTLQSTSLNFKTLFMSIVQKYLKKDGSMILGFPNCRWLDNEVFYGAKARNYSFSEQSVLYNDVIFCKKYLQQKKYRVTLFGKNYLFLTATSIR